MKLYTFKVKLENGRVIKTAVYAESTTNALQLAKSLYSDRVISIPSAVETRNEE